jgi:hypothetical protein
MARKDQFRVTVTLNSADLGVWDKKTGGEVDSEETKYRPGGMAPPVALGGSRETTNVELERLFKPDSEALGTLFAQAGRGTVGISQQPLDANGNPFGRPIVYTGVLKKVSAPEHDSESSDATMVAIEVTVNGLPAA